MIARRRGVSGTHKRMFVKFWVCKDEQELCPVLVVVVVSYCPISRD